MSRKKYQIPELSAEELTPGVQELLVLVKVLLEENRQLRQELNELKKQSRPPTIPQRSSLNDEKVRRPPEKEGKPHLKDHKTRKLEVDERVRIHPADLPQGAHFSHLSYYTVQDLDIRKRVIEYQIEYWKTPAGEYLRGELPKGVAGSHYGKSLHRYVLYKHHQQRVPQHLILEELRNLGIVISAGQLDRLLNGDQKVFHEEKQDLFVAGIASSSFLQTDDTGAKHQGKNGYCTFIGNDLFSWFCTTEHKSRINFLQLLSSKGSIYTLNAVSSEYYERQGLSRYAQERLETCNQSFLEESSARNYLVAHGIKGQQTQRLIIEGMLLGGLVVQGFPAEMIITSDGARQFNIFSHSLCWIHEERTLAKLGSYSRKQREEVDRIRNRFWSLYREIKCYKEGKGLSLKVISQHFEDLCHLQVGYEELRKALDRLWEKRKELLLVLEHPEVPIHNNLSEQGLRTWVVRRKNNGGTRGEEGKRCRDTFISLMQTCRKLKISFWDYLYDRLAGIDVIPRLADCIRATAV